jgi:hypothetical protein
MSVYLASSGEKIGGTDPLLDVEGALAAARQRLGALADRLAELRARLTTAVEQQRAEQRSPTGSGPKVG